MIESLWMASAPCFSPTGVEVGPLKAINYIFGPNGSGKTTISRVLHDSMRYPGSSIRWSATASPMNVRVYNRDYVQQTFTPDAELQGVFLLGEGSQEVHDEVESLNGKEGRIAGLRKLLNADRLTLGASSGGGSGKLGEIKRLQAVLADAAWTAKTNMPDDLQPMFRGFNNSKDKLLAQVIETASKDPIESEGLAALQLAATSAFDEGAAQHDELAIESEPNLAELDGADLLSIKIVGSGDVAIAALIEALQNSDWVVQGRQYFDPESGVCPFCQQHVDDQFVHNLNDYFDSRYAEQSAQLKRFVDTYAAAVSQIAVSLTAVEEAAPLYLDTARFKAASALIKATIEHNRTLLSGKLANPSSIVELDSLAPALDTVNEVLGRANLQIREHNSRVRNRASARTKLVRDCWNYFAHTLLAVDVARFQVGYSGLKSAIENLQGRISDNEILLRAAEDRLRELEKQVTSSRPIIDEINKLLTSVGFTNFKLAEAQELKGGYYLARPDGSHVTDSLSEGERTFITFLYFFHQLQGLNSDPAEPLGRVAVIDDPISSLDSDVLFVVS